MLQCSTERRLIGLLSHRILQLSVVIVHHGIALTRGGESESQQSQVKLTPTATPRTLRHHRNHASDHVVHHVRYTCSSRTLSAFSARASTARVYGHRYDTCEPDDHDRWHYITSQSCHSNRSQDLKLTHLTSSHQPTSPPPSQTPAPAPRPPAPASTATPAAKSPTATGSA